MDKRILGSQWTLVEFFKSTLLTFFFLPVQCKTIPSALIGTDLLCQAKSGTGKTAVFVISIIQQLFVGNVSTESPTVKAIVLAPTRELADQIHHEFDRFLKYIPAIKTAGFYGGMSLQLDREILKDRSRMPSIVIGTPGRILQLIKERSLNLSHCKHFVLDECDKMLEQMDMRQVIQRIFFATPREKQVMLFTATLSEETRSLCRKYLLNPLEIVVDEMQNLVLHGLKQYYRSLKEEEKLKLLIELLDNLDFNQVVIFTSTVERAKVLCDVLQDQKFPAVCIYGSLEQKERLERLDKFRKFAARVMVATDLLGRGIDVEGINLVINFDMPRDSEQYLHRVGRAGRFGTSGVTISFVATAEEEKVLEQVQDKMKLKVQQLPEEIEMIQTKPGNQM